MLIQWKIHARDKFLERVLQLGLNYGDVEHEIKKQRIKLLQEDGKIKTIFKIDEIILTVIKVETKNKINVITIWDSNKKEVNLWKKKQNVFVENKLY
jgi:hypothetical protein